MKNPIDRKRFLKTAFLGLGASLTPDFGNSALKAKPQSHDPFYFVHLTDQHVYERRSSYEGYKKCIDHINSLDESPAFVLMGGDMVFDGLYNEKSDYLNWIRKYKELSDQLDCPWYPCMGNHDPFGLNPRRKCSPNDPDIGKHIIQEELEWEKTYYSFDFNKWHFTVLDCIQPIDSENGPIYTPMIESAQLEWLAKDLGKAGDRPKVVVVHIALFYLGDQALGNKEAKAVSPNMLVQNTREVREVLERHQVDLVLQGHCHHNEQAIFGGVTYHTSASASGAWWGGNWTGNDPGYTLFKCENGTVNPVYKTYGWQAKLDPSDTLERERQQQYDAFVKMQKALLAKERIQ